MGRKQETNLLAYFRKTYKSQNTKIVNHLEIRFCKVWLNCDTMIRNLSSSCDRQAMLPLQMTLNDYISVNFSEDNWVGNTWLIMEWRLCNQSAVLVLYIYSPSNTTQQHMAQLLDTYQCQCRYTTYTHTQSKQECSLFPLIPYANFPSIEYCFQTSR